MTFATLRIVVYTLLPSTFIGVLYYSLLGHRSDYLGHFLAGAGGTLLALSVLIAMLQDSQLTRLTAQAILLGTLACIALGIVTESTIYRIAKFDEIDFCNQSLGAVLVGLGMLCAAAGRSIRFNELAITAAGSVALLAAGYEFAFR